MNAPLLAPLLALSALLGTSSPRTKGPIADPEPGPRITFDTTIHDFGTIDHGGDGRCSFRFTNTGDAPLIIESFRSSCGCLAPSWDKEPVLPGASGTVRLKYDTYRPGPFNKSATLSSNAVNAPTVVLRIKGMVRMRPEE